MKIDLHTHILPRDLPDFAGKFGDDRYVQLVPNDDGSVSMVRAGELFRVIQPDCVDPVVRLEDCKEHGVDMQVCCTIPVMFCYWAPSDQAAELAAYLNDHLAGVCRDHPETFVGLGTVPLQDVTRAIAEMDRCVNELGMPGIQIGSHVEGQNLNEPRFFEFFEAAEAMGAAIFVHPWEMAGGERMSKYWLRWLVGMPAETAIAACSLLFGGVLDRLPRLRVGLAHGGGSLPYTIGRIEHGFNARPDLVAVDTQTNPREALTRFYFDTAVHDPVALRHLIEVVGADRVALGSDYPFPLGERPPGEALDQLTGLTEAQRERIRAGAALEFLGIQAPAGTTT